MWLAGYTDEAQAPRMGLFQEMAMTLSDVAGFFFLFFFFFLESDRSKGYIFQMDGGWLQLA